MVNEEKKENGEKERAYKNRVRFRRLSVANESFQKQVYISHMRVL